MHTCEMPIPTSASVRNAVTQWEALKSQKRSKVSLVLTMNPFPLPKDPYWAEVCLQLRTMSVLCREMTALFDESRQHSQEDREQRPRPEETQLPSLDRTAD